jgi:isoleucyl-tRNA synthetase
VEAGQPVHVTVAGEGLQILPDEVEIRKTPKPGLAVAEEAGYLVAINTQLTDELRWEGYAREVARNIQVLRKDSGLQISDRIHTTVQAAPELAPVWQSYGSNIAADTLSVSFDAGTPAPGAYTLTMRLDGEVLTVGIVKA